MVLNNQREYVLVGSAHLVKIYSDHSAPAHATFFFFLPFLPPLILPYLEPDHCHVHSAQFSDYFPVSLQVSFWSLRAIFVLYIPQGGGKAQLKSLLRNGIRTRTKWIMQFNLFSSGNMLSHFMKD